MKLEAEKWRETKKALGEETEIIWIWGESSTGKSSLARDYVANCGEDYYVAGSTEHMWDGYESYMHTLYIDECRTEMFKSYRDMLSIFDNYQIRAVAPARYYDRELAIGTIIITSVFNPYEFYRLLDIKNREVDKFYQLQRRITKCIYMNDSFIMNSYFNPRTCEYEVDDKTLIYNPYSEKRRGGKKDRTDTTTYYELVRAIPKISEHYKAMDESYEDEYEEYDDEDMYCDEEYDDAIIEDALNLIDEIDVIDETGTVYLDEEGELPCVDSDVHSDMDYIEDDVE